MKRVVVVTSGSPAAQPIAYFSSEEKAKAYVDDVIKRYARGKKLALQGKHLTPDLGNWVLGLGPQAHGREIDQPIEYLPGAWCARVDEHGRLVGCDFTLDSPPHTRPAVYKAGITVLPRGFGRSPREAASGARDAMRRYMAEAPGKRR